MARHGRFRQFLSALLAVSLSAGPIAPAAAAAADAAAAPAPWAPNDDDSLLLEVRLGQYRLAEDLRGYQTPSGVCVDLGDTLSALDVPIKIDASAGTASGWAFEEANRLEIDRKDGKVRRRGLASALLAHAGIDRTAVIPYLFWTPHAYALAASGRWRLAFCEPRHWKGDETTCA